MYDHHVTFNVFKSGDWSLAQFYPILMNISVPESRDFMVKLKSLLPGATLGPPSQKPLWNIEERKKTFLVCLSILHHVVVYYNNL